MINAASLHWSLNMFAMFYMNSGSWLQQALSLTSSYPQIPVGLPSSDASSALGLSGEATIEDGDDEMAAKDTRALEPWQCWTLAGAVDGNGGSR